MEVQPGLYSRADTLHEDVCVDDSFAAEVAAPFGLNLVFDVEGRDAAAVVLRDGAGDHVGAAVAGVCVGDERRAGVEVGDHFGVGAHVVEGGEA